MVECKRCDEEFDVPELDPENYTSSGNTVSTTCPHCNKSTYMAFGDIAEELDIKENEVSKFRDRLKAKKEEETEKIKEEVKEESDELEKQPSKHPTYPKTSPLTPKECLKTILKGDPQMDEDDIGYMMSAAEELYGNVMAVDNVEKKLRQLNKQNKNVLCERITDDYVTLINNKLNKNPNLLKNEDWEEFLTKEPRAPNPEEVRKTGEIEIKDTPRSKGEGDTTTQQQQSGVDMDDIDIDRFLKNQMDRMEKINLLKAMSGGQLPESVRQEMNRSSTESMTGANGGTDMSDMLDKYLDQMMATNMIQSMNSSNNGGQQKSPQEVQELKRDLNDLIDVVEKQQKGMEQLKQRRQQTARDRADRRKKREEEKDETEKVKNWVQTLKELENTIAPEDNNQENRRQTDQVQQQIQSLRSQMQEMAQQPNGQINEYDAEVQKTKAEMSAEETSAQLEHEARKEEAKQRREAIESLANSAENALSQFGEGIGRALSAGPPRGRQTPQQPQQQQPQQQQAQQQQESPPSNEAGGETVPPQEEVTGIEQVFDEDGNPTGELKAECMQCGEEMTFEEGSSQPTCENCGATFTPVPLK